MWCANTSYSYCITHKIYNLEWTIHIRLLLNSFLIPYIVNADKITSFVCDSETNGSVEKCYRSIDKLTALIYLDISLVAIMSRARPVIVVLNLQLLSMEIMQYTCYLYEDVYWLNGISRSVQCSRIITTESISKKIDEKVVQWNSFSYKLPSLTFPTISPINLYSPHRTCYISNNLRLDKSLLIIHCIQIHQRRISFFDKTILQMRGPKMSYSNTRNNINFRLHKTKDIFHHLTRLHLAFSSRNHKFKLVFKNKKHLDDCSRIQTALKSEIWRQRRDWNLSKTNSL